MATKSKTAAPKKVVKKVAAKKAVTAKKTATKQKSGKVLVYADNTHSFWTTDGQIFNSLVALHEALKVMDKAVYTHHVNKDHHDFAEWVEVVLCDADCAADLRKAKTPTTAHMTVTKHLKTYLL